MKIETEKVRLFFGREYIPLQMYQFSPDFSVNSKKLHSNFQKFEFLEL